MAPLVARIGRRAGGTLFIENVGDLVCPAMFDLGEKMKAVVISTTEGEDKLQKYPRMFRAVSLVVINKIDRAPHVDFNEALCRANIKAGNPEAEALSLSAKTGEGFVRGFPRRLHVAQRRRRGAFARRPSFGRSRAKLTARGALLRQRACVQMRDKGAAFRAGASFRKLAAPT